MGWFGDVINRSSRPSAAKVVNECLGIDLRIATTIVAHNANDRIAAKYSCHKGVVVAGPYYAKDGTIKIEVNSIKVPITVLVWDGEWLPGNWRITVT